MKKTGLLLVAASISIFSCKNAEKQDKNKDKMTTDTTEIATTNDANEDWIVLFDGESLENWEAYNSDKISDWKIVDNAIVFSPSDNGKSENLMTKNEFTNFVLSLDWKISEAGNSGIMWGVKEVKDKEPYFTGPEIQILDNKRHPDAKNGEDRQAGALYDMSKPTKDVTKPAGEWNSIVIKIDHKANIGTVTMNGTQINEFPVNGAEWDALVESSKFKDWKKFGEYKTGHIALQDHGNIVSYKNIKIKKLD